MSLKLFLPALFVATPAFAIDYQCAPDAESVHGVPYSEKTTSIHVDAVTGVLTSETDFRVLNPFHDQPSTSKTETIRFNPALFPAQDQAMKIQAYDDRYSVAGTLEFYQDYPNGYSIRFLSQDLQCDPQMERGCAPITGHLIDLGSNCQRQ